MTTFTETWWINAILANDENATDEELIELFTTNGISKSEAEFLVSQRDKFRTDVTYQAVRLSVVS